MERCLEKDRKYRKILFAVQLIYAITGIFIAVRGILRHSSYETFVSLGTLFLFPAIYAVRKLFHWKGGWQLETFVYVFSFLGWTLGGAGQVYGLIPHFDKMVHCLSGVFVSVIALAMYRMLERNHSKEGENPVTGILFVFFTSMAVAGMFELCEFALAPVMDRDLQHVMDTGVTDTMMDMVVCLVGTLVVTGLMIRANHGKHDPITDAAEAFAYANQKEPVEK